MKRSEINSAVRAAKACFSRHHWSLPPRPRWDITDFGIGKFAHCGLALVTLAAEPEYCEKLMYARRGQTTPCHTHAKKKEDIICRVGELGFRLWPTKPDSLTVASAGANKMKVSVDGESQSWPIATMQVLPAGSRLTLLPGIWHEFQPASEECIIGEVSTANDDVHDNYFFDVAVGRFPGIEEDEPALVKLCSE